MANRIQLIFPRAIKKIFRFCVVIGLIVAPNALQADAPSAIKHLSLSAPRPYGYVIGELVTQTISVDVQYDYKLRVDFLPNPGPLSDWLELKNIAISEQTEGAINRYRIAVTYQLFKATKKSVDETIAGLRLRFSNGRHEVKATAPDWRFSYSPLIPADIQDAEVQIRPEFKPKPIPLDGPIGTLALLLTGVSVLSIYLAWQHGFLPFSAKRYGPFGNACRELKRLRKMPRDMATYQTGLRIVHRAINESAGNTVFGERIDQLYRVNPAFVELREQLERFFKISQDVFFANAMSNKTHSLQWLENLCKQHRAIEAKRR